MKQIVAAISQINERNMVIASAAEEQAQVAREVDRNLANIRDLSTKSAAGAEQTSCSSLELSRPAVERTVWLNRFKIGFLPGIKPSRKNHTRGSVVFSLLL